MAIESAAVSLQSALVTLGKFELSVDDRIAPSPPTHKARALLAFLVAASGRDVARERLLELFWNDFEPERAREGLRTALSSIRHALRSVQHNADELLYADKSVVRWTGNTHFDVAQFDELARGNSPSVKRAALKLYGGDFLEGTYDEWAVTERERIAGVYETVLADLVEQSQDADAARLLLARNPFHEQAYATLIDAQLHANRPIAAADVLAQCRAAMSEIGAEPSAEFQARFAHVQESGAVERAVRKIERTSAARIQDTGGQTNLPAQLTSFIGRAKDLADLKALVQRSRLVTLTGAGGIGKTRLAIEAAGESRNVFRDGVWFIDLATVSDPHYVPSAIASVLSVSASSAGRPIQETLVAALQNRHMLLVFDNCEHVVAAAARAAETLLRSCSNVTILATSRERLNVEGEDVVRLSALAEVDAVALFAERARAADKQFALSDRTGPIVEAICRRLDGIPLAIELAAPRVSVLSLKHLLSELDAHFRILTTGSSTVLPRHKTVRALIDWSYDLLASAQQTLLRCAGVFVGGFTLPALDAVFNQPTVQGDVLDLTSALAAKSLLLVDTEAEVERYRLLQITQHYAIDKLRESAELLPARERHADYFLKLMEEADETYGASNARAWLQRYQQEIDNVRAAIDYCLEGGHVFTGAALVAAARDLWQELGLHAEAMHRAQHALGVLPEDAPLQLRAGLWLVLAQVSNTLYLTPQGLESSQRARDAFEALGDDKHLAYASQSLGFSLMRAGINDEAEDALQRAQLLAERQGNRRLIMRVVLRLAQNVYAKRSQTQSLALYEKALHLARAIDDDLYEGYIVGHMADAYFALDEPAKSVSLSASAKGIFERRRDASQESNALANLAAYQFALGDLAGSKESARRAVGRAREAENPVTGVAAVQHLAALAAAQEQPDVAARLLGFADEAFTTLYFSRTHTENVTREKALELLQDQLGEAEVAALLSEGANLSPDEAYTLALSV